MVSIRVEIILTFSSLKIFALFSLTLGNITGSETKEDKNKATWQNVLSLDNYINEILLILISLQ